MACRLVHAPPDACAAPLPGTRTLVPARLMLCLFARNYTLPLPTSMAKSSRVSAKVQIHQWGSVERSFITCYFSFFFNLGSLNNFIFSLTYAGSRHFNIYAQVPRSALISFFRLFSSIAFYNLMSLIPKYYYLPT